MKYAYISLIVLLSIACGGQPSNNSSQTSTLMDPAIMAVGEQVYSTYCLACHQADGSGVPGMNPPLAGTDWVQGDKTRLIGVVLHGMEGEIEISGETYDNVMAAHAFLSDAEIAAVLSYVRNSFGNSAGPVEPAEVAALRE